MMVNIWLMMVNGLLIGFSINGDIRKWMDYMGKSPSKMDDDLGYHYFRKPPHPWDFGMNMSMNEHTP